MNFSSDFDKYWNKMNGKVIESYTNLKGEKKKKKKVLIFNFQT